MQHPESSVSRYVRFICAALLLLGAVGYLLLPNNEVPVGHPRSAPSDEAAHPRVAINATQDFEERAGFTAEGVVQRVLLENEDARGSIRFAGRIVTPHGSLDVPLTMFIHPPQRSLLSVDRKKVASIRLSVAGDGQFSALLPSDVYMHSAYVNIVDAKYNSTLFTGVVAISEDVRIPVLGEDHPDRQCLEGTLTIHGVRMESALLILFEAHDANPITFQGRLSGNTVQVAMPPCKRRYSQVSGPVVLQVSDQSSGVDIRRQYRSIDEFRDRLREGIVIDPIRVTLLLPPIAGERADQVRVGGSSSSRFSRRFDVDGDRVTLHMGGEELIDVLATCRRTGSEAFARLLARRGDNEFVWAYTRPGEYAYELHVRDGAGSPIEGAKAQMQLMKPESAQVIGGLFHATGQSGADGTLVASGIHAGKYHVTVTHPHYTTKVLEVNVPGDPEAVTLTRGASVCWDIVADQGCALADIRMLRRPTGQSIWQVGRVGVSSPSRDYVTRGLPLGEIEFIFYTDTHMAHFALNLTESDGVANVQVRMRPAESDTAWVTTNQGGAIGYRVALYQPELLTAEVAGGIVDHLGACSLPRLGLRGLIARAFDPTGELVAEQPYSPGLQVHVQ